MRVGNSNFMSPHLSQIHFQSFFPEYSVILISSMLGDYTIDYLNQDTMRVKEDDLIQCGDLYCKLRLSLGKQKVWSFYMWVLIFSLLSLNFYLQASLIYTVLLSSCSAVLHFLPLGLWVPLVQTGIRWNSSGALPLGLLKALQTESLNQKLT